MHSGSHLEGDVRGSCGLNPKQEISVWTECSLAPISTYIWTVSYRLRDDSTQNPSFIKLTNTFFLSNCPTKRLFPIVLCNKQCCTISLKAPYRKNFIAKPSPVLPLSSYGHSSHSISLAAASDLRSPNSGKKSLSPLGWCEWVQAT